MRRGLELGSASSENRFQACLEGAALLRHSDFRLATDARVAQETAPTPYQAAAS